METNRRGKLRDLINVPGSTNLRQTILFRLKISAFIGNFLCVRYCSGNLRRHAQKYKLCSLAQEAYRNPENNVTRKKSFSHTRATIEELLQEVLSHAV